MLDSSAAGIAIERVTVVIPTYRDSSRAISLVQALQHQHLPRGTTLEIVVVDDGSSDGTAQRIEACVGHLIRLEALPANAGRSEARNAGARLACGQALMFIDCDCMPADNHLLQRHLQAFDEDVAATSGPVTGDGTGSFWDLYQTKASQRRARQHDAGIWYSGSTQNLMVSRAAFHRCGGFDATYRSYGFEDRDFLLRLARHGRVAWTPLGVMRHMDELRMTQVASKMLEAGGESAAIFQQRYPSAYQALGYATLDVRLHVWLSPLAWVARVTLSPACRMTDLILQRPGIPFAFKSWLVKGLTGFGYLRGTFLRRSA